jgi:ribosomal protein L40E
MERFAALFAGLRRRRAGKEAFIERPPFETCTKCGFSLLPPTAESCPKCGTATGVVPE